MVEAMTDQNSKLEIDWLKTIGGALAAVTTAVLLSTLGAAGTLIGAAVGSVAVTISTQLYTQGLARSRETMAKAQETALTKVGIAQAEVRRAGRRQDDTRALDAHLEHADEQLAEARTDLAEELHPEKVTIKDHLLLLPWKRIALVAVATFVVVVIVIGGFERIAGRSVSSYTGGSSRDSGSIVPGVDGSSGSDGSNDKQPSRGSEIQDDPSSSASPSAEATPSATPTEPASATPTPTPTPSASTTPSLTPTPTPTASATPTPTPSPTRAPTATASPTR